MVCHHPVLQINDEGVCCDCGKPTKASHTPGPWTIDGRDICATDERKTIVCEVTGGLQNPVMHADARLIAAAPEMLTMLHKVVATLQVAELGGKSLYAAPITNDARALLARISGENNG